MSLSENLKALRKKHGISQEKFAQTLGVTRQAVQKWETGATQPELFNLCEISSKFGISLDALILDRNARSVDNMDYDRNIQPQHSLIHIWENYPEQLSIEFTQSIEEGRDIEKYKDLFLAAEKLEPGKNKSDIADVIFDMVLNSPTRADYEYDEPSSLNDIKAARPERGFALGNVNHAVLRDKITGAWTGRICGCLLGKPVEGTHTDVLLPFLKACGNYPMHRYITSEDHPEKFGINAAFCADQMKCAPSDDDTNYTVLAQLLIDRYGRDFTPYDVSRLWLDSQPKNAYCTAERVAFRNFILGYVPPQSASYKNPYREWIGAQIRGDYFGYINPGDPGLAAEYAWRDASISHIKNGIYGEMFAAAMTACAAVTDDIEQIITGGISEIPSGSRLYKSVMHVLDGYRHGVSKNDCFDDIHKQYDEYTSHGWCHTISNAMIVTAALLYGGGNFAKSICMAVETGFDTDCNGATAGSILGMRNGAGHIGSEWTAPLHNALDTTIFGIGKVSIPDCVEKTLTHIELK